jgi:hypothetical protein
MRKSTIHSLSAQAKNTDDLSAVLARSLRASLTTRTVTDLRTFRRAVRFRKSHENSRNAVNGLSSVPLVRDPSPLSLPYTPRPSSPATSATRSRTQQTLQRIRDARASYPSSETRAKTLETKRQNREAEEAKAARRQGGCWARLTEIDRARAYADAIISTGSAVAFTVNFSPAVLEAAGKAKEGVFHNLRSRISRELKIALGDSVSLSCALDTTGTGRLHIHGMLVCTRLQAQAVAGALRRAGGKWASGRGIEHQVHMKADQWELIGADFFDLDQPLSPDWGSYALKSDKQIKQLKSATEHSILYASADLKQIAKARYDKRVTPP